MKKAMFGPVLSLAMGLFSMQYAQGDVFTDGTTYMSGTMNNTASPMYIYGSGFTNSTVSFAGRAADGTFFSCYVPTTSTIYAAARDIKNNMQAATFLYVYKPSTTSECTDVYMSNASYYIN